MTHTIRGSLLSHHYATSRLPQAFEGRLGEAARERARRQLERWRARTEAALGPASSVRAIADRSFTPLASVLGFTVEPRGDVESSRHRAIGSIARMPDSPAHSPDDAMAGSEVYLLSLTTPSTAIAAAVTPWRASLDRAWLSAVRHAIARGLRWSVCFNGAQLRIVDAQRTYARHYLEFDLGPALTASSRSGDWRGLTRFSPRPPGRVCWTRCSPRRRATPRRCAWRSRPACAMPLAISFRA